MATSSSNIEVKLQKQTEIILELQRLERKAIEIDEEMKCIQGVTDDEIVKLKKLNEEMSVISELMKQEQDKLYKL